MKASDILSYSFSAIRLRKLRAGLTTLGVVIGIAAIVALLSITQGLQETITTQLQRGFATDTLIVSAGGGGVFGGGDSGFKLFINDTQTINELENVELSIAIIQRAGLINFAAGARNVTIVGVDFTEYASVYTTTFVPEEGGNMPSSPANDAIVVGKRVSDPWKNGTILCNANDTATIVWLNATARPPKYENYTGNVTAVLQEIGGFSIGGPSDFNVYIPISQAQSFFGTDECDVIIVKLTNDDKDTIESVSKAIKAALGDQVSVTSATAVLNTLSSVFSIIELFLAGIAAISLLVAGIGIMNIMIVSLMERTREIGILKALGMKSRTVLLIFLGESIIIGLLGAVIGVVSGWGLANIVAFALSGGGFGMRNQVSQTGNFNAMAINPVLTPMVTMLALAFGVGVSVIFALYPAWRASKLKPVEALRYE
ncbi:MAG: ABC transporter permease [Candidatus Bathyarchaeota archaeon]|jgi:putative ABC transport system permease protein|nr:ABC transporter permease [Candidatus Bathyarchaeota archaeon A05DMB-5]MDH7558016.1 ABC transporter permease [Candidatus Bathyarchaeota archaeon]